MKELLLRVFDKKKKVKKLQSLAFELADKILTISEGLRQVYLKKYSIDSEVLPHINNNVLKPIEYSKIINKDFFFGGSIYSINNISLKRMTNVIQKLGLKLEISTITNENYLNSNGILNNLNVKVTKNPYSKNEYEKVLNHKKVLLLALNWPDESKVKFEELSSIFPTKLIDYLSFGNIIVAHCPKDYYLAKFIEENKCGFVISSKEKNIIKEEISNILNYSDKKILKVIKNARRIANLYKKDIVINKFILNRN
jgi:hypothetical protein